MRIFNCKQLRYVWDNQTQSFNKLKGLDVNVSSAYFHQQRGLPVQEQLSRRSAYGPNEITVPYKNLKTLLVLEMLNPFYVFQIFSVILWFIYDYYYYACVILLMSMFGIVMSIIQTKKVGINVYMYIYFNNPDLLICRSRRLFRLRRLCL